MSVSMEHRKIGVHEVKMPNGEYLEQAVVEIVNGRVVDCYEFREELPMTEWQGGMVELKYDRYAVLRAYRNSIAL